jgi:hypothetical protein
MAATIEALESRTLLSSTPPGLVPIYKQESLLLGAVSDLKKTGNVDEKVLSLDVKRLNASTADKALLATLSKGTMTAYVSLHRDAAAAAAFINKELHHLILDVIRAVKHPRNATFQNAPIADRQQLLTDAASVPGTLAAQNDATAQTDNANIAAIGNAHIGDGRTRSDAAAATSHRTANSQVIKSQGAALAAALDDLLTGL